MGKLSKGTEIVIRGTDSFLSTYVNGKLISTIENQTLCSSFFSLYLGLEPISESAKEVRKSDELN